MAGGGSSTSESTSYGYLPWVSPRDAAMIGQLQANAANQAADYAKSSTNDALASITKNYTSAVGQLAPTTAAGYQAQLELNRYLGLDAVKPQAAPTAVKNIADWTPSQNDIDNYIKSNSYVMQVGANSGDMPIGIDRNPYTVYTGTGAQWDGWSHFGQVDGDGLNPVSNLNIVGLNGNFDWNSSFTQGQRDQITNYLKQQYIDQNKDLYEAQLAQYNQDLDLYNQNKAWYDKYAGEGAYTTDEITKMISEQPGYQAQQEAGIDSIQKAASARGLLSSGNMLKDLSNFSSQLQGEYYNNTLNRLAQQAAAGTSAASQLTNTATQNGTTLAGLQSQLGDTLANSALARGQAQANAYNLGAQQYKQVITGQSRSSQSSGGGLSGLGSVLGGVASLAQSGLFSSKTYKTKGEKVDFNLDDLDALPVEKWKYTKESEKGDPKEEHIGPYAEDFKNVFGVGDGKTIPLVSSLGILYGLVKELNNKVDDKKSMKTKSKKVKNGRS